MNSMFIALGAALLLWRLFSKEKFQPPFKKSPEADRETDYWDKHDDACFSQLKRRYSDNATQRTADDGRYSLKFYDKP